MQADYGRAVVLLLQGEIGKAIEHYKGAVYRHSGAGPAKRGRARFKEAVEKYLKKIQFFLRPDDMERHYDLAMIFEWQGKPEEAVSHYAEALRIKPDYAEAHNNLGAALARLGRMKEAVEHFSEAVRIKPGYLDAKKKPSGGPEPFKQTGSLGTRTK